MTDTHSKTDSSTTAKMREALHTVAREKSCAVLNFVRFDSLVCIVARSREKSRSLSLVPFLARYHSFSLSLTGLGAEHYRYCCKRIEKASPCLCSHSGPTLEAILLHAVEK